MVEIVIQKVDPREGPVRQLIEELDAYQNMLYPAESNYQLDLEEMSRPEMRFYAVAANMVMKVLRCDEGVWAKGFMGLLLRGVRVVLGMTRISPATVRVAQDTLV